MPTTRSAEEPKNVANPVPPTSKPVRGQSKKGTDKEETTYQSLNQSTAPGKQTKQISKKAVTTTPAGGDKEHVAIPADPRKRGQKRTMAADEVDSAPPTKKAKGGKATIGQPPRQPVRKTAARKKTTVIPRTPLPDRQGRNVHPAASVQPAKKRSSQEVAAEREAQKRAIEDKIREGEMAKQLLARLNVAEDLAMDDENPQRLSAAIHKRTHDDVETVEPASDDGEAFDFMDIDAMADSESDEDPAPKVKASKKAKKGTLRMELKGIEGRIRRGRDGSQEKTLSRFPPLDTAPKKYQNAGLRKDNVAKSKNIEAIDPFESGGLNDEDIYSDRPFFPPSPPNPPSRTQEYPENLRRNRSRRNELVQVDESTGQHAPIAKELNAKRTKPAKPRTKAAPPAPVPVANSEPGNTVAMDGSEFLHDARWKKIFNPTLTHALYISREPFISFASESAQFLATVQNVFDLSFRDVSFSLSSNDPVVTTAYERVKTRKSKLASSILKTVKDFFQKAEFDGQPAKIREYVCWALRGGPAYYALPIPKSCKVFKKGEPGYIAPEGFLESEFIAPVAQQYLKYAANSVLHPSLDGNYPPKGLYAMILLSVERAFTAHLSGTYVEPPPFSHDNYWKPLQDFLGTLDNVSKRRWNGILAALNEDSDDDLRADQSMISAYRAEIYVPSSPMKA